MRNVELEGVVLQYTPISDLGENHAVMVLAGYQGDGGNSVWRMLLSCSDQSRYDAGYSELLT